MDREKASDVPRQGGIGRTNFINAEEASAERSDNDISAMDQQEGEMAHGELGGNLGSDEKAKPDAEKSNEP